MAAISIFNEREKKSAHLQRRSRGREPSLDPQPRFFGEAMSAFFCLVLEPTLQAGRDFSNQQVGHEYSSSDIIDIRWRCARPAVAYASSSARFAALANFFTM